MSFGLTPADISAHIQGMLINSSTTPSTQAVQDIIDEAAAKVRARVLSRGIPAGVLSDSSTDSFRICRNIVRRIAVARTEAARSRSNTDLARASEESALDELTELINRPGNLGADKPTSPLQAANWDAQGTMTPSRFMASRTLSRYTWTNKL